MKIDRRLFLFSVAMPLYPAAPLKVLTAAEGQLVEALCDRIVPADESPGAKQAGVLYYIDRQLAGPLQRFTQSYRTGLAEFAEACQDKTGRAFVELTAEEQTEFLRRVERGAFFQMVVDHTMQGFYGSPAHGGNHDEASWKMLNIVDVMEGHSH